MAVIVLTLASSLVSAAHAAERLSRDEIAAKVAETYGVEVLRLRDAKVDGRAAYAVTVMNPDGNSNAAFQVSTLLVDAATGALIPTFRHGASGYDHPGGATYETGVEGTGPTMRQRSLTD
ncbi:hypothetical protein [Rhodospirillaceae bacterium SYSU D60014]|uniref:PepSY domain-containing protein n=1 Tax=Virgifigura deserti TaxID=2268457 RepID=UPI0013C4B73C